MRQAIRFLLPLLIIVASVVVLVPLARSTGAAEQERFDAASKVYTALEVQYQAGTTTLDDVYVWSVRIMQADRAVHGDSAAVQAHAARMAAMDGSVQKRVQAGIAPRSDELSMKYYVAEARVWTTSPPR
jgi:hypothetical protein